MPHIISFNRGSEGTAILMSSQFVKKSDGLISSNLWVASDMDKKDTDGIARPATPQPAQAPTKIRIIEDGEATGDTAEAYNFWRAGSGRQQVPGIIKCFGARPDFLRQVVEFSNTLHFSEGHLSRRHKEMIASYVSYLNRCPYWLDSHAYFLRVQGANEQCVAAILEGKISEAGLTPAEYALMQYAELITKAAYRSTVEDVVKLRDHGWTEDQITEAVYVIAMFAFFNRVADAFGVPPQNYLSLGSMTP
jgi:uncharacterized peroxidase-related enzyme